MRCPECKGEGWITFLGGCWQQCPTCKGRRELETSVEKIEDPSRDKVVVAESRPAISPCGPSLQDAYGRDGPLTIRGDGMTYSIKPGTTVTLPQGPHGTQELLQLLLDKVDALEVELERRSENRPGPYAGPREITPEHVLTESAIVEPKAKSPIVVGPTYLMGPSNNRFVARRYLVRATSDVDGADMARQGLVSNTHIGVYPLGDHKIPCEAFEGPRGLLHDDLNALLIDYYTSFSVTVENRDRLQKIRFDVSLWVSEINRTEQCMLDQQLRERFDNGR